MHDVILLLEELVGLVLLRLACVAWRAPRNHKVAAMRQDCARVTCWVRGHADTHVRCPQHVVETCGRCGRIEVSPW